MSARPHVRGEVPRAGVAERHGGVLGPPGEQQPERPPDGDPAADDDDLRAGDRHVVAAEQLDDADRRARQRPGHVQHQPAQVHRVQAVGVLGRVHRLEDACSRRCPRAAAAGRCSRCRPGRRSAPSTTARTSAWVAVAGSSRWMLAMPTCAQSECLRVDVPAAARVVADQQVPRPGRCPAAARARHPLGQFGRGSPPRSPCRRGSSRARRTVCPRTPTGDCADLRSGSSALPRPADRRRYADDRAVRPPPGPPLPAVPGGARATRRRTTPPSPSRSAARRAWAACC